MNSKIRVEYDFDKKEPFIQFYLEPSGEVTDLRDEMLKNFIEQVTAHGADISYPYEYESNSVPQLRIKTH